MPCPGCGVKYCPVKWGAITVLMVIASTLGFLIWLQWAEGVAYEKIMGTEWLCRESGVTVQFANSRAYFSKGDQVLAILDVEQGETETIWKVKRQADKLLISWVEEEELQIGGERAIHKIGLWNELNGVYVPPPESFKIRLPIDVPSEIELGNEKKERLADNLVISWIEEDELGGEKTNHH